MEEVGIKDEKMLRLIKAAHNSGGTIESDMMEAMGKADTEKDFEWNWYWMLRNHWSRVKGFYNEIAGRLDQEKA